MDIDLCLVCLLVVYLAYLPSSCVCVVLIVSWLGLLFVFICYVLFDDFVLLILLGWVRSVLFACFGLLVCLCLLKFGGFWFGMRCFVGLRFVLLF